MAEDLKVNTRSFGSSCSSFSSYCADSVDANLNRVNLYCSRKGMALVVSKN